MKKIIVIPDSFKGTMSSSEVCEIMRSSLASRFPSAEIIGIPIADGGEGTLDCFSKLNGTQEIICLTVDALVRPVERPYLIYGDTAIIETAAVAGFSNDRDYSNPMLTTTFGMGLQIKDAIERGCKKIIIGLGGSCTNDGGCGLAAALGVRFKGADGRDFIPAGGTLSEIESIDTSSCILNRVPEGIDVTAMCDVSNPLFGPDGAAYVFAPQKGASPEEVALLDNGLIHLSEKIKESLGTDVSKLPGSGAAGGLGAGISAFLGGRLVPGIDTLLEMVNFNSLLAGADCVITGEGKFDMQSLRGKAISGICRAARAGNVPVIVVAGILSDDLPPISELKAYGISAAYECGSLDFAMPLTWVQANSRRLLADVMQRILI